MTISPKYSLSHYYRPLEHYSKAGTPHTVNLFVDYDCPFSAKLFLKLKSTVLPEIEKQYPGKFQFIINQVIQPWHPNSIYLHEFALSIAKLIREKKTGDSELFWSVSESLFKNIKSFYDNVNSDVGRNQIYKQIYSIVAKEVKFPFSEDEILENLVIPQVSKEEDYSNLGNAVAVDVKYFTRYHRTLGIHVTPTVTVDGIVNGSIESSTEPAKLVEIFGSI